MQLHTVHREGYQIEAAAVPEVVTAYCIDADVMTDQTS